MVDELPARLRKPRLRRSEAAEYLALVHGVTLSPRTLEKLAQSKKGPVFCRMNRTPLYRAVDLDTWVAAKLVPAF